MSIIETIDNSLFRSRFEDYKRVGDGNNFSYAGLDALFEYLDDLSYDGVTTIELDVIGLCCEFSEASIEDALKETGCDDIGELRDNTTVIEVDCDTIIYAAY